MQKNITRLTSDENLYNRYEIVKDCKPYWFTNFYVNIIHILMLLDCNVPDNEKVVMVCYNGKDMIKFDEEVAPHTKPDKDFFKQFFIDTRKDYIESGRSARSSRSHLKSLFHTFINTLSDDLIRVQFNYNPLACVFYISKKTLEYFEDSEILTLSFDRYYDVIAERINHLTILAQNELIKYMKNVARNKTYSINDLVEEMIAIFEKKNFFGINIKDKNIEYFEYHYKNFKEYHPFILDYNRIFEHFYLDNIKLITFYSKMITYFQQNIKDINFDSDNNENNIYKDIIKIFQNIGCFPNKFKDILAAFKSFSNSSTDEFTNRRLQYFNKQFKDNIAINGETSKQYFYDPIDSIIYDTLYHVPNTIINLYKYMNVINKKLIELKVIKNKIKLYGPNLNILDTSTDTVKSTPLYELIKNMGVISNKTAKIVKNHIDNNSYRIDDYYNYEVCHNVTYGDQIKFSNMDANNNYGLTYFESDKIPSPIIAKGIQNYFSSSIFQGYIQNNINPSRIRRTKYLSSIWVNFLYGNELLLSTTNQVHQTIYDSGLNHIPERITHHLLNRKNGPYQQLTNSQMHSCLDDDQYRFNFTHYQTTIGSMILMRSFMIGILEMISNIIQHDQLKPLKNKQEMNNFKKYFKNSANGTKLFNNHFKIFSSEVLGDHYSNKIFHITRRNTRNALYLTFQNIMRNEFEFTSEFDSSYYEQTFHIFFTDSMKMAPSVLERISTISKEDIISSPYV